MTKVVNAITRALADGRYLKLACDNDPLTGNLETVGDITLQILGYIGSSSPFSYGGTDYVGGAPVGGLGSHIWDSAGNIVGAGAFTDADGIVNIDVGLYDISAAIPGMYITLYYKNGERAAIASWLDTQLGVGNWTEDDYSTSVMTANGAGSNYSFAGDPSGWDVVATYTDPPTVNVGYTQSILLDVSSSALQLGSSSSAGGSFAIFGSGSNETAFLIDSANDYDITIGHANFSTTPNFTITRTNVDGGGNALQLSGSSGNLSILGVFTASGSGTHTFGGTISGVTANLSGNFSVAGFVTDDLDLQSNHIHVGGHASLGNQASYSADTCMNVNEFFTGDYSGGFVQLTGMSYNVMVKPITNNNPLCQPFALIGSALFDMTDAAITTYTDNVSGCDITAQAMIPTGKTMGGSIINGQFYLRGSTEATQTGTINNGYGFLTEFNPNENTWNSVQMFRCGTAFTNNTSIINNDIALAYFYHSMGSGGNVGNDIYNIRMTETNISDTFTVNGDFYFMKIGDVTKAAGATMSGSIYGIDIDEFTTTVSGSLYEILLRNAAGIYFRDGNQYIQSGASSELDINANSKINLLADVEIASGIDLDCYTNGGYFKPRRVSQSLIPTPDANELMVWRDPDDNKTYLVYNDTDEGVRSVEIT